MNILLLSTHLNPGGISSYILNLAKGLRSVGNFVIVSSSGGKGVGILQRENIAHITIPIRTKSELSPKIAVCLFKLLRIIKENKIQIIHSQTRVTQVLGFLLSKITGIPYISTCHGFFRPRWSRRVFGCWGENIIAISKQVKRHLVEDFKIDEQKISLIYNGIHLSKYKAVNNADIKLQRKKRLGLDDSIVIGIIARLSPVKGHSFLIKAFKEVLRENYKAKLLIVGDGLSKDDLLNLVKNLEIQDYVLFHPSVENTGEVLEAIDILCAPSLKEGLGLSILEAFAAGVAVVASCVGGITEIVEDKKTGILVPPSDYNALKDAIISLITNPELKRDIINNALELVKTQFSLKQMVIKTEEVYNAVLH